MSLPVWAASIPASVIVLDRRINSMTEFEQIIGRGTRINEDYGKLFFTIMDFRQATKLFADPDFDGDPVQIYEPKEGETVVPPDEENDGQGIVVDEGPLPDSWGDDDTTAGGRARYVVDDVPVTVLSEQVQYLDPNGKLITVSLRDYSKKSLLGTYASLENFLTAWKGADRKQAIIDELTAKGVFIEELAANVGRDYDAFDLICHVAYDQPPLTRRERANRVKKRNVFAKHGEKARAVLEALLEKYADTGITSVESLEILKVDPFTSIGTPIEIIEMFGSKAAYLDAVAELESVLYSPAA